MVREGITGGIATKADLAQLEAKIDGRIDRLEADLKWMKLIGGAILAALILPWLAELLPLTMPGG